MTSVRILGTGSYVPPKRLTNFDLQEMGLDTSDEWIVQRTGVKERRIADPEVTTSAQDYERHERRRSQYPLGDDRLERLRQIRTELFEPGEPGQIHSCALVFPL